VSGTFFGVTGTAGATGSFGGNGLGIRRHAILGESSAGWRSGASATRSAPGHLATTTNRLPPRLGPSNPAGMKPTTDSDRLDAIRKEIHEFRVLFQILVLSAVLFWIGWHIAH
jgi:hypothetical protein